MAAPGGAEKAGKTEKQNKSAERRTRPSRIGLRGRIFSYLLLFSVVMVLLLAVGLIEEPISYLQKGEWYWGLYTVVNIWKSLGWSTIIYLSAMSGVDEELYQAGVIDGLGRLGLARHITLPTIIPTIVLLWIMNVGNILSAGFDQHLIIGNTITQRYWDVIDTYSYRYGVQQGYYSMGTAVSFMKALVGFVLVLVTNCIARRASDVALF